MTDIMRRTPLSTLQSDFARLFEPFGVRYLDDEGLSRGSWVPAVDIAEEGEKMVVRAELPGIPEKDIEIQFENGVLTIRGEKKFEKKDEESNYYRIERSYGTFTRSFTLPRSVDPDGISASYRDGILEVTIPKKEEARPRQIKIKVD